MADESKTGLSIDQKGSTIVEMLVVVLIIAIVSTIALLQYTAPRQQFSRQNVSRELKVFLERARFDSVKRRADSASAQARVVINATSYTLSTDKNGNGTIDSGDAIGRSFSGTNIAITGTGMVFPVTVYFDQRGEVQAIDGASAVVNPVFRICLGNCSTPTNGNSDLLIVTPTGTVNLLGGSANPPAFATPPVSPITGGTDIEPLVIVP